MVRGAFRKSGAASSSPTRPPQMPGVFVRPNDYEQGRRPYGLADLIQGLPGQLYTPEGLFVQPTAVSLTPVAGINSDNETNSENDEEDSDDELDATAAYEKQQNKKRRQWRQWSEVTIPTMLKPYMELLRVTNSLRDLDHAPSWHGCTGCHNGRMLEVLCIYFNSKLSIKNSHYLV